MWIHFDRKGLASYEIVVCNAGGEYRLLGLDPAPSRKDYYRNGGNIIIEDWDSLVPVPDDVLAATLESDSGWPVWMLFLVSYPMFGIYWVLLNRLW